MVRLFFSYEGLSGFGKVNELHVESDSDRNAINTLIDYVGLPIITLYRKDYQWYAKADINLPIHGDVKLINENEDFKFYELNFDSHYTRWG